MCNLFTKEPKLLMGNINPNTPIQYLKGVGPYLAQIFQKKAVYTAWDLLFYLPIKYIDRRKVYSVKDLPVEKKQTFLAEIVSFSVRSLYRRRRKILEMIVGEKGHFARVSFFQFNENYLRKKFPPGTLVLFFGDVKLYKGVKTVVHPDMEIWDEDQEGPQKIYPFYSLTEGLYQKTIRRIFQKNLDELLEMIEEDSLSVRAEGAVKLSLKEAFRFVHMPPDDADMGDLNSIRSPFHQRIVYDEFFYLQLGLLSKRYRYTRQSAVRVPATSRLVPKAVAGLPFKLTGSQQEALFEIKQDFMSGHPMNRLLQGDVGSGKTMVAFLASLMAIESQVQVAFMAPTEILAEQHFQKIYPFEAELGFRVELLTGSTPQKKRQQILSDLQQGHLQILIGTHALLTPDVCFANLGFVIIDEQHRFGVMQRSQLKNKTKFNQTEMAPHLLVMTATPIPRTLSMSFYGDLDVSLMKELPQGRQPIQTNVFWEKQREKMYELVRKQLEQGRQAYFIYPLIEESEKLDLKDAQKMHEKLSKVFADYKVGLLHGRLSAKEKEEIMRHYKNGDMAVLVATTVVEVGVDVPNATVMVIEHAERFGLSQLHQLRGRVGRGCEKSFCFLLAGYARSLESRHRLKVMEETQDGFVIAQEDLKLRGPGQFLGTQQSGLPDFRLAELVRDSHLLKLARKRADEILKKDADLKQPENQLLKKIMLDRWGQRLDLILV